MEMSQEIQDEYLNCSKVVDVVCGLIQVQVAHIKEIGDYIAEIGFDMQAKPSLGQLVVEYKYNDGSSCETIERGCIVVRH
jgi:hypothetical protein